MEIGAVKQAFNNELILLKKNLNQAKIQIIHKLTRKAKQLTEKKAPDALKEKNKRKAESAVREVLIIKKIKPRDIGKFIVTHKGKLQEYLNKPEVDNDKACARLLLHKVMQEKYNFIRNRFSDISIKDLFMSRQERRKLKKEEMQKKKEKRDKKKGKNNVVNAEGDWDVEDVKMGDDDAVSGDDDEEISGDEKDLSDEENGQVPSDDENEQVPSDDDNEQVPSEQTDPESDEESLEIGMSDDDSDNEVDDRKILSKDEMDSEDDTDLEIIAKLSPTKKDKKSVEPSVKNTVTKTIDIKPRPEIINKNKPDKKHKDNSKNKNLKDKIINKKFKRDSDNTPNLERKVVDPFFITSTGENYMSVAEPRQPDEFKEEHRQGNRQHRRAVMFGHVPKNKPRQDFRQENNKLDRQNGFNKRSNFNERPEKFNNQKGFPKHNRFNDNKFEDNRKARFNDRNERKNEEDSKPEKLHPSWEAKKKQSGILPFKGKKIVFDDS